MSYLNKLISENKKKHRVGRGIGSGSGKTCGKGHKGQKSRSGYNRSITFEGGQTPLNRRLPKFGFKSKKTPRITIISKNLNKIKNKEVSIDVLKEHKILKKKIKLAKIVYKKYMPQINIKDKNIKISKNIKKILNGGGGI